MNDKDFEDLREGGVELTISRYAGVLATDLGITVEDSKSGATISFRIPDSVFLSCLRGLANAPATLESVYNLDKWGRRKEYLHRSASDRDCPTLYSEENAVAREEWEKRTINLLHPQGDWEYSHSSHRNTGMFHVTFVRWDAA